MAKAESFDNATQGVVLISFTALNGAKAVTVRLSTKTAPRVFEITKALDLILAGIASAADWVLEIDLTRLRQRKIHGEVRGGTSPS